MLQIELNIIDCTVRHVQAIKDCVENNGYKWFYHGYDHLVITIDNDAPLHSFSKMVVELDNICNVYGKKYLDILV